MHRLILASALFVFAGLLSGCGGDENAAPAPDAAPPDGKAATDQMNQMIGVPQPGGEMKKE